MQSQSGRRAGASPGASVAGKVALVTGAGVRVGRAIALELGRAGATVAVHFNHSRSGADEVVAELKALGVPARAFCADLRDEKTHAGLVREIETALGPVSILVNSAARYDRRDFLDTDADLLDAAWTLNARAPYLLTQAVARGMRERGEGQVVNVLDIGGALRPWRHYSAYCMTKAAMRALTECLALELAPEIRVNGVAPGTVLPPEHLDAPTLDVLRMNIPLQRFGSAEDVARTVRFLVEGPAFVTGQVIAVDGGRSLGSARTLETA